jgi:hypothetical protein
LLCAGGDDDDVCLTGFAVGAGADAGCGSAAVSCIGEIADLGF